MQNYVVLMKMDVVLCFFSADFTFCFCYMTLFVAYDFSKNLYAYSTLNDKTKY